MRAASPPPPARPPPPGRPPRGHAFPARGRWGGDGRGRGRGSARPGWLADGQGERGRASRGQRAPEAETRQGAGLGGVPGTFESPGAASAWRRLPKKQDLGNQHAHCSLSFLIAFPSPSIFLSPFTFLPPLSQVYLTGAGGFSLRDALAAAQGTLANRAQVGKGPGRARSQGSPLAAAVAVAAAVAAAAAGEAAPRGRHQNWSVI